MHKCKHVKVFLFGLIIYTHIMCLKAHLPAYYVMKLKAHYRGRSRSKGHWDMRVKPKVFNRDLLRLPIGANIV